MGEAEMLTKTKSTAGRFCKVGQRNSLRILVALEFLVFMRCVILLSTTSSLGIMKSMNFM